MNSITSTTANSAAEIAGKVVVITGASSGLGEATARHLAVHGARLVLAARRTDRLQSLAAEIRNSGGEVAIVTADVSRLGDVQAIVADAIQTFGRIDVWVNNAGLMSLAPMSAGKTDEWDRMIDINIKGTLYGIAAAMPVMEKQGSGHFINLASIAGHKVFAPIGSVYSATKFAVRALSEGLRMEAPAGIRTTIISPGAVQSELKHGSSHAGASAAVSAFYEANQIPADSVARAIAYAISQPEEVEVSEVILRPTVQEF